MVGIVYTDDIYCVVDENGTQYHPIVSLQDNIEVMTDGEGNIWIPMRNHEGGVAGVLRKAVGVRLQMP